MKTRLITLLTLLLFALIGQTTWADELDSLSDIATEEQADSESELDELGNSANVELGDDMEEDMDVEEEDSDPKISFGGYIKTLAYWNQEEYSDLLWSMYQRYADKPSAQDISGFNNVGTRLQLKMEGYLGEHARLFSAMNVNYNTVGSVHDSDATANTDEKQNAEIRMVEAFVEIYENSRIWKIGPQLVTWSYLEGMEVPTDRVNARDNSYKSTEYEDSKLPSTGVLLTQKIGDVTQFEVLAIPVAKTNINMEFMDYLFPGDTEYPDAKPNQTKWATRFSSTAGKLDYAVSYVEGIDPVADLNSTMTGKAYNRIKSPGLDLQYNLGSWLAKLSAINTITEDEDGSDPLIKNNWSKYVVGGEFTAGEATINIYAGQTTIEDFDDDASTNFLLGQIHERTDFISGHVNADFLTGNALNMVLMAANYWDEDGESVQSIARVTLNYKVADGLNLLLGTTYMDIMDNRLTNVQTEVKYSF